MKIAPGLRMNLSGSGVSWSLGARGASVNFGRRGVYGNTSIPFTGLYQRSKIGGGSASTRRTSTGGTVSVGVSIGVNEDGTLKFTRHDGRPASPELLAVGIKQQRPVIVDLLEREAAERQEKLDALGRVHEDMPDPTKPPVYAPVPFETPEPTAPQEPSAQTYGVMGKLFEFKRREVDARNADAQAAYARARTAFEDEHAGWAKERDSHDAEQTRLKALFESGVLTDVPAMEEALELAIEGIPWPKETTVSFEVTDEGTVVALDVDLPEIEDMPTKTWQVLKRDMRLVEKDLIRTKLQDLYVRHVHSVGIRLAGEVFATLPKAQTLVLSAYSQRPNKATGQVEDQYLYSARIGRSAWSTLNFAEPAHIDPVAAFDSFETRRKVTKTGVFTPVEPMRWGA